VFAAAQVPASPSQVTLPDDLERACPLKRLEPRCWSAGRQRQRAVVPDLAWDKDRGITVGCGARHLGSAQSPMAKKATWEKALRRAGGAEGL
jgi:hypothetical protein